MGADIFREGSSYRILWPTGNNQLELPQAVDQSSILEHMQKTLIIIHTR